MRPRCADGCETHELPNVLAVLTRKLFIKPSNYLVNSRAKLLRLFQVGNYAIMNDTVSKLDDLLVGFIELNGIKHHKGAERTLGLPSHLIEHFLEEFFRHAMGNAHDVQRKFVKSFQGSGKRRTSFESKPFEKRIS